MPEAPRRTPEEIYEPSVIHYKATDFIFEPEDGFKAILKKIPAVAEATDPYFWEYGGKIRIPLNDKGHALDLYWEPEGMSTRTALDLGIDKKDGFKLAFLTVVDPQKSNGEWGKRSSFLYGEFQEGQDLEPVVEDRPTAAERIEELKKELKTYIPSKE